MAIELCGQEFKTKKAAQDFVRSRLRTFDQGDPLWMDLLARHPNKAEKVGAGIRRFFASVNWANPNATQLNIERVDGSTIDVSWRSCIDGKAKDVDRKLVDAMRLAVMDQTQEYKQTFEMGYFCENCDVVINEKHMAHVDHIKPFKTLATNFIKDNEPPKEFDECGRSFAAKFKNGDKEFENKWKDYHRLEAKLRLLCAKCNLTRPK